MSRKRLCWSLYLIKLKTWRPAFLLKKTPTQVFSCEYFEIFKDCFFIEHLLFIILFQNFMWLYDSLDVFGYKIDIFYISWTIALSSIITLSEWVLHGYSVLAFIPEYLISVTFVRITALAPRWKFLVLLIWGMLITLETIWKTLILSLVHFQVGFVTVHSLSCMFQRLPFLKAWFY